MAKIVDITDKLNFDENPKLVIKGEEYEVNADAVTVLKIMGVVGDGSNVVPKDMVSMYGLIFPEEDRRKLEKLNLQFDDFQKVVESAIGMITGTDNTSGE